MIQVSFRLVARGAVWAGDFGEGEHAAGEFLGLLEVREVAGLLDRLEARTGDQRRNRRGRICR
jgi:hypothetical protein